MEELKKRKIDETRNGEDDDAFEFATKKEIRLLTEPLSKPQLVELLATIGSKYPPMAEEIKSIASADPVHRKLYVHGLALNTDSETLCAAFEEHGEIEEGYVSYDKATGNFRGYGFITYKNMESAQNALKAPSKLIDGRSALCRLAYETVSRTNRGAPDPSLRKLYIGHLSPDVTSKMLRDYFRRHGDIVDGSVAYEKSSNASRGFGFVTYKTVEAAKKAIDDPNKTLWGRNIIVRYADIQKGKGGQQHFDSRVDPMAALPMTPIDYTYPQTALPYAAAASSNPYQFYGQNPYQFYGQSSYPENSYYYYPNQ